LLLNDIVVTHVRASWNGLAFAIVFRHVVCLNEESSMSNVVDESGLVDLITLVE
jgi:hypothetical protein